MSRKKRPSKTPGKLLRALRQQLGLSQYDVAKRGPISRLIVTDVELGGNKMSSFPTRTGMARGLGILVEEFDELFAGNVSIEMLAVRVREREPGIGSLRKPRRTAIAPT